MEHHLAAISESNGFCDKFAELDSEVQFLLLALACRTPSSELREPITEVLFGQESDLLADYIDSFASCMALPERQEVATEFFHALLKALAPTMQEQIDNYNEGVQARIDESRRPFSDFQS